MGIKPITTIVSTLNKDQYSTGEWAKACADAISAGDAQVYQQGEMCKPNKELEAHIDAEIAKRRAGQLEND